MAKLLVRSTVHPASFEDFLTVGVSAGSADFGRVAHLGADGKFDSSLLPTGSFTVTNLQDAYNGGAQIIISVGSGPMTIKGYGTSEVLQVWKDSTSAEAASIDAAGNLNAAGEVKAKSYTGSLQITIAQNMTSAVVDTLSATTYRAVHYAYTVKNSDNSGYETGDVYIVHDGSSTSIMQLQGATIGTPCGIIFSSDYTGGTFRLLATTDNSAFSRILHLFKVAIS